MEDSTRIRISLTQQEVEVEGREAFVRDLLPRLEALLARLGKAKADLPSLAAGPAAATPPSPGRAETAVPASPRRALPLFGEFIHHLPADATEVDKMLAAGFWVQLHSPERSFATAEASRRLAEHGIRIGNPSQCVRQNIQAKRVFLVRKGRYRVAQAGVEHLRRLMGEVVPLAPPAGGS